MKSLLRLDQNVKRLEIDGHAGTNQLKSLTAEETRLVYDTFNLIDVDQDGIITNEDLVAFSETLTKTLGRTIWEKEGLFREKAWLFSKPSQNFVMNP